MNCEFLVLLKYSIFSFSHFSTWLLIVLYVLFLYLSVIFRESPPRSRTPCPTRTNKKLYSEGRKTHFVPFGWNNDEAQVGKKKTFNVCAPEREVCCRFLQKILLLKCLFSTVWNLMCLQLHHLLSIEFFLFLSLFLLIYTYDKKYPN